MSLDKPSRRHFLKGLGAVAAGAAIGIGNDIRKERDAEVQETLAPERETRESLAEGELDFLEREPSPRMYSMGALARVWKTKSGKVDGIHFSGSLAVYTGIYGRVPAEAPIDFKYQQAFMWKKKIAMIRKTDRRNETTPQAIAAIRELYTSYDPDASEKMDILQYQGQIGQAINKARAKLDLRKLREISSFKNFDDDQIRLVAEFERRITAMSLLGYSATEIAPSSNSVGVEAYDFLLRRAGKEYLETGMAALSDGVFSFGPYQLTPGVFYDAVNGRVQGAKLVEPVTNQKLIPDTLYELRGAQHHAAAYLFAVYNAALLARRLHSVRSARLAEILPKLPGDFVTEFIAAAHHRPESALNACENFLARYMEYEKDKKRYQQPDFIESCMEESDIGPYARKTRTNLAEIRKYFSYAQLKARSL